MPDALPAHLVAVDGFWMDRDAGHQRGIRAVRRSATGYVTVAERPLESRTIIPACRETSSCRAPRCSTRHRQPVPLDNPLQWWRYTPGASWKHPEGRRQQRARAQRRSPGRARRLRGRGRPTRNGPASGCRPRREFEFAARGGLDRNLYPWGNELTPGGKPVANTWQGHFPANDQRRRRLPRDVAGDGVSAEWIRPVRHGRQRLAVVRRLVPARLPTPRCAKPERRAQPAGTGRQLRSAGTGRRETRPARRIVPVHRSILRALSGGQPRQSPRSPVALRTSGFVCVRSVAP